jgi:hypothetical protein
MVGASLMGFDINEIPAIVLAHKTGMTPTSLDSIEIRGSGIEQNKRRFVRPNVIKWSEISNSFGAKEL